MSDTPQKNPGGRPLTKIDWPKVEDLTASGCLGNEIASVFGITPNTFYELVEKQYGIKFSEFRQKFMAKGDAGLRAVQYRKAMKGDNTMLLWLGKNRLGQRDKPTTELDQDELNKILQYIRRQTGIETPSEPSVETE